MIYFWLAIRFSGFPVHFTFFFVCHVLFTFSYFPLRKARSCSKYTHFHSRKLEFLSNLGTNNSLSFFWSLLTYWLAQFTQLRKPLFCIIHPLRQVFHPCDNSMAFLSLSLIASYAHCLNFVCSWQKYLFALVCRFIFCYFLEFFFVHLEFPWGYYIVRMQIKHFFVKYKLSLLPFINNLYGVVLNSCFVLIYNCIISGSLQ